MYKVLSKERDRRERGRRKREIGERKRRDRDIEKIEEKLKTVSCFILHDN
jgi:hypothetical protein